MNKKYYRSKDYDWRSNISKRGFPYEGINDPKYIKDRNELFAENGNGWWWYQGTAMSKFIGKNTEEQDDWSQENR